MEQGNSVALLKSQGMSNRAVAHRLGVSEKAIRKLVGPSTPAESAQLAFAGMTTAAAGAPPAAGVPTAPHLVEVSARGEFAPIGALDDYGANSSPTVTGTTAISRSK
jgi:hypothetical protein